MSHPVQALESVAMRVIGQSPGGASRADLRTAVDTCAADGTYPGWTLESVLDLLDARGWVWLDGDLVRLTAEGATQWTRMRGR